MEVNFLNKVVLVTGASAGIGEATALLFAKYNATLSLVGRNEKNLKDVADRCEKEKGIKPFTIVADLATDEGCERTAKETLARFGRLDVLVNNAGMGARSCLQNADMETFDRMFSINVRSVYNLSRLLVPALIESKGNIVTVSSINATTVSLGNLPYGMAKASVDHFTRLVALELAPKGVRVNAVSPGITISTIVQRTAGISYEEYQEWLKKAEKAIPMGKVCEAIDVARMIVHVAGDNCRLVTGAVLPVDGCLQHGDYGSLMTGHIQS